MPDIGQHHRRRISRWRRRDDVCDLLLAAAGTGTHEHSYEVTEIAAAVADQLGLDREERERVRTVARLHDIGKVEISTRIIDKPGPLDEDEWRLIRGHTIAGERLAANLGQPDPVPRFVRHSHERWDGGGYPDGLRGEQIPVVSRIVFCADAFDAIRSERPYSPARSPAEALSEVRRCAGTQFDPLVVDALSAVIRPHLHETPHEGRARLRRLPKARPALAAAALCALSIAVTGVALLTVGEGGSPRSDPPGVGGGQAPGTAASSSATGVSTPAAVAGQGAVAGAVARGSGRRLERVKAPGAAGPPTRFRPRGGSHSRARGG